MLHLNDVPLSASVVNLLNDYQQEVDAKAAFTEKVKEAKSLFGKRNKKTNRAFKEVRKNLTLMSGGTERCHYCEDSKADEVEHIYPKDFYPERCFRWLNYCYACGPCNGPKNNQFAVFDTTTDQEVDLKALPEGNQPPAGLPLLIDPRVEEPTDYLFLDIALTFNFTPFSDDPKHMSRALYTIRVLGLNTRSYLVRARRNAFASFKARLFEYVHKKEAGASPTVLNSMIDVQKSDHHQTVWFEMKRQRTHFPELDDLFNRAPEALAW